jgi:hypothetical protein
MKPMYYYYNIHSSNEDNIKEYIASCAVYIGEEELMNIFENEIYIVDCYNELKQYCMEYGFDYNEMRRVYNENK